MVKLNKIFIEIVIAPSFTQEAIDILTQKKNIRILQLESISKKVSKNDFDMKKVMGGLLVQQ